MKSITDSSNGSITKEELKAFIQGGFLLSKADREAYQKRSKMHHLVVQFFDGIDKQRITFDQTIKDGKNIDKQVQQYQEEYNADAVSYSSSSGTSSSIGSSVHVHLY